MSKDLSDLSAWARSQYIINVNIDNIEGSKPFKTLLQSFIVPNKNIKSGSMTGRKRIMSNFLELKFLYPIGPDGYSCMAMTASMDGVKTNYAYAYWRRGHESENPEYICISPTFDSRDGEYRNRFIRVSNFLDEYEKNSSILTQFEDIILELISNNNLELKSLTFPESSIEAEKIEIQASSLRLLITAFTVALALDITMIINGLLMIHTISTYVLVITKIAKIYSFLTTIEIHPYLNIFRYGNKLPVSLQCGQKLVPMRVRETMQVFDYNFAVWRELIITRKVSDLGINFISPSFALYNQWTFIEGCNQSLFENASMEEQYTRGSIVDKSTHLLRDARINLDNIKKNNNTDELDLYIYESLKYAQSFLLMSPIVMVHIIENVGLTMQSLPSYVRQSLEEWPSIINAFADPDIAARNLFELSYGAHCIHTKIGIAHTDLHCNNMTLYIWSMESLYIGREDSYNDPIVAFIAGPQGEADTYIFPANGDSACIIDFSRAIIGPSFKFEDERSPQYIKNFYYDQVMRVMRVLYRYAPEYVKKHQITIKAAIITNYESVFPILCAVDFIAIGTNMGELLTKESASSGNKEFEEIRPFIVSEKAIAIAKQIATAGREFLLMGLRDIVETRKFADKLKISKFPGEAILKHVFGDWLFTKWMSRKPSRVRTAQLVDMYNYNNPITYNGSDYSKFPPWAKVDEIERHLGEYKITDIFDHGVDQFLESINPGSRIDIISEQVQAQQEKNDVVKIPTLELL